jgi:carbamoyltransferase
VSERIDTHNHERFIEHATVSVFEQDSQVRSQRRVVIPAVTQMDGCARPQTVEKRINPLYWRLIHEFEMHTGVPVLLNTASLLRGEAIVHTFSNSGMGALVLGSFQVEK